MSILEAVKFGNERNNIDPVARFKEGYDETQAIRADWQKYGLQKVITDAVRDDGTIDQDKVYAGARKYLLGKEAVDYVMAHMGATADLSNKITQAKLINSSLGMQDDYLAPYTEKGQPLTEQTGTTTAPVSKVSAPTQGKTSATGDASTTATGNNEFTTRVTAEAPAGAPASKGFTLPALNIERAPEPDPASQEKPTKSVWAKYWNQKPSTPSMGQGGQGSTSGSVSDDAPFNEKTDANFLGAFKEKADKLGYTSKGLTAVDIANDLYRQRVAEKMSEIGPFPTAITSDIKSINELMTAQREWYKAAAKAKNEARQDVRNSYGEMLARRITVEGEKRSQQTAKQKSIEDSKKAIALNSVVEVDVSKYAGPGMYLDPNKFETPQEAMELKSRVIALHKLEKAVKEFDPKASVAKQAALFQGIINSLQKVEKLPEGQEATMAIRLFALPEEYQRATAVYQSSGIPGLIEALINGEIKNAFNIGAGPQNLQYLLETSFTLPANVQARSSEGKREYKPAIYDTTDVTNFSGQQTSVAPPAPSAPEKPQEIAPPAPAPEKPNAVTDFEKKKEEARKKKEAEAAARKAREERANKSIYSETKTNAAGMKMGKRKSDGKWEPIK